MGLGVGGVEVLVIGVGVIILEGVCCDVVWSVMLVEKSVVMMMVMSGEEGCMKRF